MESRLVDDLLDAGGGDGEVLGQGVVGAAVLDELEEEIGGELGGHCVGWVGGSDARCCLSSGFEDVGEAEDACRRVGKDECLEKESQKQNTEKARGL